MKNNLPRISIIMAVYNMADTVKKAIDSAANQNYPYKELIIIEGASEDNTVEVLKANESVIDHWESVSSKERGIYSQWNRALPYIKGDWINFLGADDVFPTLDVLSQMAPYLNSVSSDIRLVYGKVAMISSDGSIGKVLGQHWNVARDQMYRSMPLPHPGTFHHRSLFEIHGPFNDSFKISGDYEFILREVKTNKALFIPDVIVRYMAYGGVSTSWKHDITRMFENARSRRLNGLPAYTKVWFNMFAKVIGNYIYHKIIK